MKKMYVICFLVLGAAFSAVYYGSYRLTTQRLEGQIEQQADTGQDKEQAQTPAEILGAAKAEESIITRKTAYVLEEYSLNDDSLASETISPPVEVLGYDRKKMLDYIQESMENLSEEEQKKGLISYELTDFSRDRVVLRKTYYKEEPSGEFYLDVQMGRIVVYQTEDNNLYAYTEVKFNNLPEELRREILAGKYIENIEELYQFLESYSS